MYVCMYVRCLRCCRMMWTAPWFGCNRVVGNQFLMANPGPSLATTAVGPCQSSSVAPVYPPASRTTIRAFRQTIITEPVVWAPHASHRPWSISYTCTIHPRPFGVWTDQELHIIHNFFPPADVRSPTKPRSFTSGYPMESRRPFKDTVWQAYDSLSGGGATFVILESNMSVGPSKVFRHPGVEWICTGTGWRHCPWHSRWFGSA